MRNPGTLAFIWILLWHSPENYTSQQTRQPHYPLPPRQQYSLTTAAASPNATPALQKLLRKGSRKTTKSPRQWSCLQTLQVPNQQHHCAMRWKKPNLRKPACDSLSNKKDQLPASHNFTREAIVRPVVAVQGGAEECFTLACIVSSSFMLTFEISVPTVMCSMIQSIALCCMWLGNAWKCAVLNMIQVVNPSESRLP